MLTLGGSSGEKKGMGTKRTLVHLSKKDKKLYVDLFTDVVEGWVLQRKLSRNQARRIYKNASIAFDIPELHPYPCAIDKLKGLLKHKRSKPNGHAKVNIPGDPPLQDIKPNNFKKENSSRKQNISKFFPRAA